jgi:excisionase family DNA binding protein
MDSLPSPTPIYTVDLLAARLLISARSAYDLIRQGQISYNCLGKKNYRVTEADVVEYLDRTKVRAA